MNQRFFSQERGFTLIELMIVLVIIAILAAIAYPSYAAYVMRSNRAAAQACLSQYANYMERYYTTNLSYAANAAGKANPLLDAAAAPPFECATKTGSRYTYTVTVATPTTYTLAAAPKGTQLSDTQCGTLSLDQTGEQGATGSDGPAGCWKY